MCSVRHDQCLSCLDGQVTLGHHVVKPNAKKVRWIGKGAYYCRVTNEINMNSLCVVYACLCLVEVMVGFAGSTADAMTLYERLEMKLEEHKG